MTQPTSQEWKVNKIIYPAGQDVSFEVLDEAGDIVCQTIMREVIAEDERIAIDAQRVKLFAAAPELLSALKALHCHYCGFTIQQHIAGGDADRCYGGKDTPKDVLAAMAAILKAGGQ